MSEQLKGHGHVTPNADGFLARCGGPSICKVCKAEIAALKAQEPVEYQLRALIRDVTNIPEAGYYMPQSWHDQVIALSLSGKLDAPVSEAKAQGVVMPDVNAAAKALCNRHAMICGVDADDQWKEYSQDFIADAETVLANARLNGAPVQQVSVPQCVLDWFEAKQAHVTAVDAYNARLAFVREHMPFGTSVDPEYQIMEASDRKARSLVWPMFSGLRDLSAAPAAPAADAGLVEFLTDIERISDDYHADNIEDADVALDEMREALCAALAALAASRTKGVV